MAYADYKDRIDGAVDYDAVKDMMVKLVRTPSPQTELMEAEPQILAFIKNIVDPELREMGVDNIAYDGMGNLIARYGTGISGKRLMMVTHAMNAAPATMPAPYAGTIVDGGEYGLPGKAVKARGICEQKAGMAALLMALRTIIELGYDLDGELIFTTLTSGETGKHDAIASVVEGESITADYALLDGDGLRVRLGNRGRVDIFITVYGEPSHSGSPVRGCDAITGARLVMDRVLEKATLPGPHPDLGACTLTFVHIRSFPDATHTVQERCEITVDRRLLPGDDPDEVFREIAAIAKSVETETDPISGKSWRVECVKGPFMYPHLVAEDSEIVTMISDASEAMLGYRPETHFGQSAFDQGYLNHIGIQTANYGPGEERFAHTDYDMASIDRCIDSTKVFALIVCSYLGAFAKE